MWLAAALTAELALAGPNGLQVLHSPIAEQTQQQQMVSRLGGEEPSPLKGAGKPHSPTAEEIRAAAWRADHLTCASGKGRTRQQFQAECGAWQAQEAARAEPAPRHSPSGPGSDDRLWPVLKSP